MTCVICRIGPCHTDAKAEKLTFHCFPRKEDIRAKWMQFCAIVDISTVKKRTSVCSRHFPADAFRENKLGKHLKLGVIPSLEPPPRKERAALAHLNGPIDHHIPRSVFKRCNERCAKKDVSQDTVTQGGGRKYNADYVSIKQQGDSKGDYSRTISFVSDRDSIEESPVIQPLPSTVNDSLLKPLKIADQYIYEKQLLENVKNKLCRICGTKQEQLTLIFEERSETAEDTLSLSKKIEMCLSLKLGTNKTLPPNICEKCRNLVESWHELHVACLAADSVLRKMFRVEEEEVESCDGDERSEKENIPHYRSFQGDSSFPWSSSLLINVKNQELEDNVMQLKTLRENNVTYSKNSHIERDHMYCTNRDKADISVIEVPQTSSLPSSPFSPPPPSSPLPLASPPPLDFFQVSYRCRYCGEMFATKEECTFHREQCATEPAICDVCGTTVSKRCHLRKHIAVHHKSCLCKVCGEELKGRESLKIHKKAIHSKKKKLSDPSRPPRVIASRRCKHCGETFASTEQCRKHGIQCGSEPAMCEICGQTFSKRVFLKRHISNHHSISSSQESHLCEVCGKHLGSRESLRNHYNVHTGERYFCEPCCRVFTNKLCHKNHQKLHEKGVVLVRCLNFQINITADDGGKMKCTCPVCGQSFPDKMSLISHMNEKKRKRCPKCKEILFNERQSLSHNCRQWVCRFCRRHLYCRGDLRVHERRHTGEKPYRCQVCDAKFVSSRQLGHHQLKHKSMFPCEVCGMKFGEEVVLMTHRQSHNEDLILLL